MTRTERWDCVECAGPGVRNLGTNGYCGAHLSQLYSRFDPLVFGLHGVMVQSGKMRPDFGPAFADCVCIACGATEVAIVGESCAWCLRGHEIVLAWQIEILLRRPDVDSGDQRYSSAIDAWAERLARAVLAGVVDRHVARRVLEREVAA